MSLLRDIQDSAVGKDTSVEVMLRQCLVLAARLKNDELKAWVQRELVGYPSDEPLPSYRPRIYTQVLGDLVGAFGSGAKNAPLAMTSVPDDWSFVRDFCFFYEVRAGVPELEAVVASGEQILTIPWPADVIAHLQGEFYQDMALVSARQVVPATVFKSTLSHIRERVLQFALDIEAEAPEAGEATPDELPISEQRVAQIFTQHFYGDNATVMTAGRDVHQNNQSAVDVASLKAALHDLGVGTGDTEDLMVAVADDRRSDPDGSLPRTRRWMARLEQGSIQLGSGVAIGTATGLLSKVLGIG